VTKLLLVEIGGSHDLVIPLSIVLVGVLMLVFRRKYQALAEDWMFRGWRTHGLQAFSIYVFAPIFVIFMGLIALSLSLWPNWR
jgi:hypothetical protein